MKKKILAIVLVVVMLLVSATGCSVFDAYLAKVKGNLVGQHFEISLYDDYSNKTLTVEGSKVTVGLLENSANFKAESTGFQSEVLEITVNGNQMFQVGNTVIFEEDGLDKVTNFEVPEEVAVASGGGFVPFDRFVNDIKNDIGEAKTIIISSQQGIPLAVYQGEKVYVEVPSDLPKMTRLIVDGKSLYIHRANYTILDTNMIK